MKKTKIVVWATGWIGRISIAAIERRPDLELVGVWVHSPDKVGVDAGELAGIGPVGVAATDDVDALLDLRPDCVVYAASGPERDAAAIPDYVRLLEAGVNVVSTSTPSLVYPPAYPEEATTQLARAAEAGGVSFYNSGIEPGFAGDHLPLTLASLSRSITSIRAIEIFLYHEYPVEFMMRDVMGFGLPLDHEPLLATPGAQSGAWGPSIHLVAEALGVRIDELRETYEREPAPRTIETASGPVEAGTCGAIWARTVGVVDGRERITIEHVNRMAPDFAPDWPSGRVDGTYRVEIDGEPPIRCDMTVGDPASPTEGGMIATAMRVVNAVQGVVEAEPGLLSSLDLPVTLPRAAFD